MNYDERLMNSAGPEQEVKMARGWKVESSTARTSFLRAKCRRTEMQKLYYVQQRKCSVVGRPSLPVLPPPSSMSKVEAAKQRPTRMPDLAVGLTRLGGHTKPLAGTSRTPEPALAQLRSASQAITCGDKKSAGPRDSRVEGIQTSRLVRLTERSSPLAFMPVGLQRSDLFQSAYVLQASGFDTVAFAAKVLSAAGWTFRTPPWGASVEAEQSIITRLVIRLVGTWRYIAASHLRHHLFVVTCYL